MTYIIRSGRGAAVLTRGGAADFDSSSVPRSALLLARTLARVCRVESYRVIMSTLPNRRRIPSCLIGDVVFDVLVGASGASAIWFACMLENVRARIVVQPRIALSAPKRGRRLALFGSAFANTTCSPGKLSPWRCLYPFVAFYRTERVFGAFVVITSVCVFG